MTAGLRRAATGLVLCGAAFVIAYLLGERHEYRGWEFVIPFLAPWAAAMLFGWSLDPRDGLLVSGAFAAASVIGLGMGLVSAQLFDDPVISEGYRTWVLLSLAAVPLAWLLGLVGRRLRAHAARP